MVGSQTVMQIFVKLENKICAFQVNRDETINDFKLKICTSEKLRANETYLMFQGLVLDNDKSFELCGIFDRSIIEINARLRGGIQIHVTDCNSNYVFNVSECAKVIDLAKLVAEKLKISSIDDFYLTFDGIIMKNDQLLTKHVVFNKSTIFVKRKLRSGTFQMIIFVKIDDEIYNCEITSTDKIRDIKNKIQYKIGLHPDSHHLTYNGEILQDNKSLIDYEVGDEDNIVSRLCFKPCYHSINITIKTMDGTRLDILTGKNIKVASLKTEIEKRTKIHRNDQRLFHQKIALEDEKTIDEYGISDESMISVMEYSKNSSITIVIQYSDRQTESLSVSRNDKIIGVKKRIKEITKIEENDQYLLYQSGILEDSKSVWQYGISDQSRIKVLNAVKISLLTVLARTMDGKVEEIQITKNEKIIDLKKKIEEKIGLSVSEQHFVFKGNILSNYKTAEECKIIDKSVINIVDE